MKTATATYTPPWTSGRIRGLLNSADIDAIESFVRAVNAHDELLTLVKDLAKFAPLSLEQRAQTVIAKAEVSA